MKKSVVVSCFMLLFMGLFCSVAAWAQSAPKPPASPADSVSGTFGEAKVTIRYSSPSVKGRKVWGELVPYGKVWRAGANEATTITVSEGVAVEGNPLPAGTYALFALPTEKEWTIIFNTEAKQWGAFKYDEKKDALRVTVSPRPAPSFSERLVYLVDKDGIVLRWENLEVPVKIR
ncbi:DUF2911 domain-containing protein [Paraflavisolibacter sp. H34]|uniref:DUF2911 domain-containing protein n=1 Tax=Huijunlia imazamoxiresistens TaxID=3127457 RepID=UPI0030195509